MDVLQRIEIEVPAKRGSWTDTGLVVQPGESLHLSATGAVIINSDEGLYAYPEGRYADDTEPNHDYLPGETRGWSQATMLNRFPARNIRPFSLAVALRPGSEPPNAGINQGNQIYNALQGDRDVTFPSITIGSGGRVWLVFNDHSAENNRRSFTVTVERLGAFDPLSPGSVSPIRFVPPAIARAKMSSIARTAMCWFIQPLHGPAEGYTEWDAPIECPEYVDATGLDEAGNELTTTVPTLTYLPFTGLSITAIPVSIKLGVDAPDVNVVRFDLKKLRREYYEGAFVEVFEVPLDPTERFEAVATGQSNRVRYLSGTLGNSEGYDGEPSGHGSATIELTPFEELLNVPTGRTISPLCDVGRLPGETFGRVRCENTQAGDGIKIALWTRGAQVSSVRALSKLTLAAANVSPYSGFENNFPGSHGILIFRSGELQNLRRDVGTFNPATGEITLRRALPFKPQIGDLVHLEAGCDHLFDGPQGCGFWNNRNNFRGFPHVPGRAALIQRYTSD